MKKLILIAGLFISSSALANTNFPEQPHNSDSNFGGIAASGNQSEKDNCHCLDDERGLIFPSASQQEAASLTAPIGTGN